MTEPIRIGDTLTVAEQDYEWGTGDLTLRVTAFEASQDAGPAWIKVKGMEIDRDGVARREREVLVRRAGMRRVRP
jgi:hypothetical protein